jgi:hypothetical protein
LGLVLAAADLMLAAEARWLVVVDEGIAAKLD